MINLKIEHENIAKMVEVQETPNSIYLLFENMVGGCLDPKTVLTNKEIRRVILSILKSVDYLENLGIVHRDLKPSNIMFDSRRNLKIIDFGLSSSDPKELCYFCGTPEFIAPELYTAPEKSEFNSKIDVFSIGVIFYFLQFGRYPLEFDKTQPNFFRLQSYSEQVMEENDFLAYDLLQKMLFYEQKNRLGVKECLKHPYFSSKMEEDAQDCLDQPQKDFPYKYCKTF